MPSTDGEHSIDVRVDSIMAEIELDEHVNITLAAWQWIALGKLAEHYGVNTDQIVQRWVRTRLERLATHVAPPG